MPKKPSKKLVPKPPVVTIMGHVDHGKTTLLDFIRKSNLTSKESGGITQHIGAYQISHNQKKITFIDTPGHAAFSKMRARGAALTDIVILVVAADDGVMPQTKESIRHIKQSGVPLIVAINKIDLSSAVPEMAKAQLVEEDIKVEGYGGSTPVVEISAKDGVNVEKLLDTILVLSEIEELSSDPKAPLQAVVIESSLKKNIGPTATLLIKQGTLSLKDNLTSVLTQPPISGKVKQLLSGSGKPVLSALPSTPVEVLGLKSTPPAGTIFTTPDHQFALEEIISKSSPKPKPKALKPRVADTASSDAPSDKPEKENAPKAGKKNKAKDKTKDDPEELPEEEEEVKPTINIILKADTKGSLEAIKQNLSEEVILIKADTGQVGEADVLLAHATKSVIIAYNIPTSRSAQKLAGVEGVFIKSYDVIYQLLEEFESEVLKLLEPTIDEETLGEAKVLKLFDIKDQTIIGCSVASGSLTLGDQVHLKRGDKIIQDSKITSLKQGKVDAKQIKAPEKCGLILKPTLTPKPDDLLIAFKKQA